MVLAGLVHPSPGAARGDQLSYTLIQAEGVGHCVPLVQRITDGQLCPWKCPRAVFRAQLGGYGNKASNHTAVLRGP